MTANYPRSVDAGAADHRGIGLTQGKGTNVLV
jgi:hypothetical protein